MRVEFETWESLNIRVGEEVPTIHYVDSVDSKCSFRIDKAEWVNNLEGEQPLDDKFYVKELYDFLKMKPKDKDYGNAKSFWEYAKRTWNINNPDNKVTIKKMPDYRKLEPYYNESNYKQYRQ